MNASDDEVKKWLKDNREYIPPNPRDQVSLAGRIANSLGKAVHVNGINVLPDTPPDPWWLFEVLITPIGFVLLLVVLCVGVAIAGMIAG